MLARPANVLEAKYLVALTCNVGAPAGGSLHFQVQSLYRYDPTGAPITRPTG